MSLEGCPLFTAMHAHHSAVWTIPGFSIPRLCIACATERLETKGELAVHVKKVLGEFRALLGARNGELFQVLSSDKRVLEHLCSLLFGLLMSQNSSVAQLSIEVLISLLNLLSTQDVHRMLLQRTIRTVMMSHNFSASLPHLTFLGQLLHCMPLLCVDVIHSYGGFLEFLLGGMAYPEETVKSAVIYILVQVCSRTLQNSLPIATVQSMCRHISTNLATAKSHELTINLLGLVKALLKSGMYTQCLVQADQLNLESKGSTFASAFKRVLLSRDEMLQLSGVQCIAEVLAHHAPYGQVLLRADIAEFMFEALSSKNELLMNSLFSCLNSLATIDEFYSKSHVIYGIEPVIAGLSSTLRLRNYSATQLGFSLLSKILTRQPGGVPLFNSHEGLNHLLEVVSAALQVQVPAVTLQATVAFSNLLRLHHFPPGFPLSTLLPLLALLLSPLTATPLEGGVQPGMTPAAQGQLSEVLISVERMCKLCSDILEGQCSTGGPVLDTSDCSSFLFKSFEENLLPIILVNFDQLEHPGPFASLFGIARHQLLLCSSIAATFAERLGFIQMSFDVKIKFNTTTGHQALCNSVNGFLETMCFHLEKGQQSCTYVTDVLHSALPSMNCSASSCLKFLSQRATGGVAVGKAQDDGVASLRCLQGGTLALFYLAFTHGDSLVPRGALLQALASFLSLNPDIHMLPATMLTHLCVLYAIVSESSADSSLNHPPQALNHMCVQTNASQILVRGLLRVLNPTSLFVPHGTLLKWAFCQDGLVRDVAPAWVLQWLKVLEDAKTDDGHYSKLTSELLNVLEESSTALECLLGNFFAWARTAAVLRQLRKGMLTSESSVDTAPILSIIGQLISQKGRTTVGSPPHDSVIGVVFSSLQRAMLVQRVEPLPDSTYAAILQVLVKLQAHNIETTDLKLIYQITNIITRAKLEDSMSSQSAKYGMDFLCGAVQQSMGQDGNSQVPLLLLGNAPFVLKLASCVPSSASSKHYSPSSASALELIAMLILYQQRKSVTISPATITLNVQSLTAALLSPLIEAQVAGLHFWRSVFLSGGKTGCFVLQELERRSKPAESNSKHIRVLVFLVLNCLTKDSSIVKEAAASCFMELLKYASSVDHSLLALMTDHYWNHSFFNYLTDMHQNSALPHCYVQCLATVLNLTTNTVLPLRAISQLLYKSYIARPKLTENASLAYTVCFKEIERLDSSSLDSSQWKEIW